MNAKVLLYLFVAVNSMLLSIGGDFTTPRGAVLLPSGSELKFFLSNASSKYGSKKVVSIEMDGAPFKQALEVHTAIQPPHYWDFQLVGDIQGEIRKDDTLWVSFWLRTVSAETASSDGAAEVCIERNGDPWEKLGVLNFHAGSVWQQAAFAFRATHDYPAGTAHVGVRFGFNPQTVQLAGLQIINCGIGVRPENIPHTKPVYKGMELDASWRMDADARIKEFRKADMKIIVTDAQGIPKPGVTVSIRQRRHAFGFGSAVRAKLITGNGIDNDRYRAIVSENFTKVVFEDDLKWGEWERTTSDGHRDVLSALRWLRDRSIDVRGHNLVWPSWRYTPNRLTNLKNSPVDLEREVEKRIRDTVNTTHGLISDWDVVNEPYQNHDVLDLLPSDTLVRWFKLAHEVDPAPVLFLNDYAGFMNGGDNTPHKTAFEKTLRDLTTNGAPLGGLGIQAHFDNLLAPPELLVRELDRWATLGLDVQITEFDLNIEDEELQAQYTRDFMTAVFSHPSVSALLMWGFWEKAHWQPNAALWRNDWSPKPNALVWHDLVFNKWWTRETLVTNDKGEVTIRAFLGDYDITVSTVETILPLTVSKTGAILTVSLP
jgi:GH35 family endo-1,4-beta-xylanase